MTSDLCTGFPPWLNGAVNRTCANNRAGAVTSTLAPGKASVMHRIAALAFFLVFASAVPAFGQTQPLGERPSPGTPTDTGDLYVFNDSGWTLIPSDQVITDNGKRLISLPRQTYAKVSLSIGVHQLRPDPFLWKQEVSLNITAGSRHYVVVAYKPDRSWALPLAGSPLILREITEQEAAPLLKEMKSQ